MLIADEEAKWARTIFISLLPKPPHPTHHRQDGSDDEDQEDKGKEACYGLQPLVVPSWLSRACNGCSGSIIIIILLLLAEQTEAGPEQDRGSSMRGHCRRCFARADRAF